MSRPTPRPWVPVVIGFFLLVAVVTPTPAIGASWRDGNRVSALLSRLWGAVSAVWGEEGCIYDPNGRCREGQAVAANPGGRQVTANAGCEYDPDGRCRSGAAVEREAGCDIDGNGGCQP